MEYVVKKIAEIRTDFPEKFGIPRQPGVVAELRGRIVFEPDFRNADSIRGLEEFSHIWLIWQFSENLGADGSSRWTPTVRPPRLGGNKRLGVFATRSPFRPNPLGLSVVSLDRIEYDTNEGPVIYVRGADMVDRTPIYDIKPYIAYADSVPDAKGGFTDSTEYRNLEVVWALEKSSGSSDKTETDIPEYVKNSLEKILSNDPRPHYQNDPDRIYGMSYAGYEVKFRVDGDVLYIMEIIKNV